MKRREYRRETLIDCISNQKPILMSDGKEVILCIPDNANWINIIREVNEIGTLVLLSTDGTIYHTKDIVKTALFGGRGAGAGTFRETIEYNFLSNKIKMIKEKKGVNSFLLKVNNYVYSVADIKLTAGFKKSDFHFVDQYDNPVVWVSHKHGSTPRDFLHWGGFSKKAEPKINSFYESQQFVNDLYSIYPNGLPQATTIMRPIQDETLKMMTMYGNEYGYQFSDQNVQIILQGSTSLVECGAYFELSAKHVLFNGQFPNDEIEPCFMAMYKKHRNDFGLKDTRVMVVPKKARKVAFVI